MIIRENECFATIFYIIIICVAIKSSNLLQCFSVIWRFYLWFTNNFMFLLMRIRRFIFEFAKWIYLIATFFCKISFISVTNSIHVAKCDCFVYRFYGLVCNLLTLYNFRFIFWTKDCTFDIRWKNRPKWPTTSELFNRIFAYHLVHFRIRNMWVLIKRSF